MNNLHLTQDLAVEFDDTQWIVRRHVIPKKPGKSPYWRSVSYHNRLEHALQWVLDRELGRRLDQSLLEEAREHIQDIPEDLRKAADILRENPQFPASTFRSS